MVLVTLLLLLISLVVLVVSSEKFVESGERLAKRIGIGDFVLGITIIAIGTTLPELAIGITASFQSDFALNWGDIVGSCIANIGLVLAISILVTERFDIQQKFFKPDLLALMAFTFLFILFGSNGVFSPLEGIVLIVLFLSYLLWLTQSVERARALKKEFKTEALLEQKKHVHWIQLMHRLEAKNSVIVLLSMAGLWIGANGTVEFASALAKEFSVSQTIIGFTILAIGTSLPNILVSLSALHRHLTDVFLGSIIGANIATLAMVGGVSMLINPMLIPFAAAAQAYGFLIIITTALFFAAWVHPFITKSTAFFFMVIWLVFLVLSFQQAGV
jgi:cation:H+ antiporter